VPKELSIDYICCEL